MLLLTQLLFLLIVANGGPVIGRALFKDVAGQPVDGGWVFVDGQPLFGRSKTVRGLVLSLLLTTAVAVLLGLTWWLGALIAIGAMVGDLASSFSKRRLRLPPSSQALGLDQIPESLLPLLLIKPWLPIALADIALVVVAFVIVELALSRVLYRLRIRERPY